MRPNRPHVVNQRSPSVPAAMPSDGRVTENSTISPAAMATAWVPFGSGNSRIAPDGVIRPILSESANHRFPSGPAAIPERPGDFVGNGNSVIAPDVVIRPILLTAGSVNQRAPSGPAVMA